jgi:hypothetical protein
MDRRTRITGSNIGFAGCMALGTRKGKVNENQLIIKNFFVLPSYQEVGIGSLSLLRKTFLPLNPLKGT